MAGDAVDRLPDKLACRRIDPVSVFEHHQHRFVGGDAQGLLDQRIQGAFLALFWRQLKRSVPFGSG